MSRNLCRSKCCSNTVRLSNLRGRPIEFRRYYSEAPVIGTRWDCPDCHTAYFVIWRDAEWNDSGSGYDRGFVLDLSYYESYNDEHDDPIDLEHPRHVCVDNAENRQEIW